MGGSLRRQAAAHPAAAIHGRHNRTRWPEAKRAGSREPHRRRTGQIVEQIVFDLRDPISVLRAQLSGSVFVADKPGVGATATGRFDDADVHHGGVELVASMSWLPQQPCGWPGTGTAAARWPISLLA